MAKNVQIPETLLFDLFKYFLLDGRNPETETAIKDALGAKYQAIVKRSLYETSHRAEVPEQREAARQKYLEMAEISEDFRWSEAYEERRKRHE